MNLSKKVILPISRVVKIAVIGLLVFCFAACQPEAASDEDLSISEITIVNIPKQILVHNSNPEIYNNTFKVYVNASNSQNDTDPPATQGDMIITPGMLQANGTYTVVIPLMTPAPNPAGGNSYSPGNEPWSGTAGYFSIMIAPQNVNNGGVNAIWVKGGMQLDRSKENMDWNDISMNFRNGTVFGINLTQKTQALYDAIICNDPDITK